MKLDPKTAVFDCDGTLWAGDAGESFFWWELEHGMVSDAVVQWARRRYASYRAGKVSEEVMCGEMVTLHRGLEESVVKEAAARFFEANLAGGIFPEMRELIQRLQANGCEVWVVSASNRWIIESAMRHFGIAPERVLASTVEIDSGIVTDRLVCVPSGEGKPRALRAAGSKTPDVAFGNSRFDAEMLAMARQGFAVNPNPDLERMARDGGWTVYYPVSPKRGG